MQLTSRKELETHATMAEDLHVVGWRRSWPQGAPNDHSFATNGGLALTLGARLLSPLMNWVSELPGEKNNLQCVSCGYRLYICPDFLCHRPVVLATTYVCDLS